MVLSEAMHNTITNRTKDGPLKSTVHKQLNSPKRSSNKLNGSQTIQRNHYKPSQGTKTYFANSQGNLKYREDPQEIIKPDKKGNYQIASKHPSTMNQGASLSTAWRNYVGYVAQIL